MGIYLKAFEGNIICPNKHKSEQEKVYNGRMLESETYIGGHVECLESGVFRSDIPTRFHLTSDAYQVIPLKFTTICLILLIVKDLLILSFNAIHPAISHINFPICNEFIRIIKRDALDSNFRYKFSKGGILHK